MRIGDVLDVDRGAGLAFMAAMSGPRAGVLKRRPMPAVASWCAGLVDLPEAAVVAVVANRLSMVRRDDPPVHGMTLADAVHACLDMDLGDARMRGLFADGRARSGWVGPVYARAYPYWVHRLALLDGNVVGPAV